MYSIFIFFKRLFLSIYSLVEIPFTTHLLIQFKKKTDHSSEIFILGNGPSLQYNLDHDFELLKDKTLLCVNGFSLSNSYEIIKPKYYLFADSAFWDNNNSDPIKSFVYNVIETIITKTNWPLHIFIPIIAKRSKTFINRLKSNPFITINYFNSNTITGFEKLSFYLYKHNLGVPSTQNVLIPSLIIAINLGFKNIYLLGADHSWHENCIVDNNNIVCLKDTHFYNQSSKLTPLLKNNKPIRIHEMFESLAKVFRTYHVIQQYANYRKVNIYNASEKSYVDAFLRIKLSSLK